MSEASTKTKHFAYVHYDLVEAYMRLGWMVDGVNPGHHGYYGVLMVWPCSCPVQVPPKENT